MKKMTVVIPVYKDWETLEKCIESLKKYLDCSHKVILVNDMSPEWTFLEDKIKNAIKGYTNFEYFRNEKNMGFVKTCNRAVFELDKTDNDVLLLNSDTEVTSGFAEELMDVLYIAEKHGVVCPRSNNATLLSIPVNLDSDIQLTPEQSYYSFTILKDRLPRYQVMPTGVGFAFLIKRKLISEYGLFDEIYSPGYNEENDFVMRINQYGFNVVMANRAFVFHYESKSFGDRKNKLDSEHAETLLTRYPYYLNSVRMYFDYQISPVDYFGDLIADLYEKKKVLISLYEMPAAHNGTAQHGLLLLENFVKLFDEKYDISILINQDADLFFGVSEKYKNVFYPHTLTDRFYIAYVPSQIIHIEHMHILNRHCLKYAFCMQDIISIRSRYLLVEDWEREIVFRKSIDYCDGIIPFSHFSLEDTEAYYSRSFSRRNIYTHVVPLAGVTNEKKFEQAESCDLPYSNYIAVMGNRYKHKNLDVVMPFLQASKHNYIVIGSAETGKIAENVYGYKSGGLSDAFIEAVVERSDGILFPSVYEGFGLPILNALEHKKKIIVNDNPLNREQREQLPNYAAYMYLFQNAREIDGLVDAIYNSPKIWEDTKYLCNRTWKDVAMDVEQALEEIMQLPVNFEVLQDRWEDMRYEERVHRCYLPTITSMNDSATAGSVKEKVKRWIIKRPKLYSMAKKIKDLLEKTR